MPHYDTPGFPEDARTFSLGHAAELEVLQGSAGLDWVVLAPPPIVLDDAEPRGHRTGGTGLLAGAEHFSYADLAVALVDEVETPKHHRSLVAVG